jgi:hypothetical protein
MDDQAGLSARLQYERRRAARERAARERRPRIGRLQLALGKAPSHELAWLRGAEGEERAAARLTRLLAGTGVVLLHDRRIPGTQANIDHLAVGPGGITVIDTKRLTGKVQVRGRGLKAELRVGRRGRSKLLEGVAWQLERVRDVAGDADIAAALCFVETGGLPMFHALRPRGILVDGPRAVARLARRPGPLDARAIDEIAALLDAWFPKAAL